MAAEKSCSAAGPVHSYEESDGERRVVASSDATADTGSQCASVHTLEYLDWTALELHGQEDCRAGIRSFAVGTVNSLYP